MHSMHFFLKRKDGMSLADFYNYWEHVHGPLVKPWAEKHDISYKQPAEGPAETVAGLQTYDGIAVFEYADADTAARAFADPEFVRSVSPDQAHFMQADATISIAGGVSVVC